MGEAKRKRELFDQIIHKTTEELVDQGKLIMAGFAAYRKTVMSPDAPEIQVRECFLAYMAGCQHLWASMLEFLEPGDEVTAKDEKRVDLIFKELQEISGHLYQVAYPTKGKA